MSEEEKVVAKFTPFQAKLLIVLIFIVFLSILWVKLGYESEPAYDEQSQETEYIQGE